MRLLSRLVDLLFLVALLYAAAIVAIGVDVKLGPVAISSRKIIVPGMIVWLLAIVSGLLHWRRGGQPDIAAAAEPSSGGLPPRAAFAIAVLLVAVTLQRAIGRPFFMDDLMMVDEARKLTLEGVGRLLRGMGWSTAGFIRPLPELVWWLEYRVHGCVPLYCHLLNLGLHLVNVALVGAIARQVVPGRHLAGWAMLLFAVCGTHAEPLLWLASRYDLLATTFGLAAVAAFIEWFDTGRPAMLLASVVALVLAMFSKEAALGLPLGMAGLALVRAPRAMSEHPADTVPLRSLGTRVRAALVPVVMLAGMLGYRALVLPRDLVDAQAAWVGAGKLLQLPLSPLAPLTYPVNMDQIPELSQLARLLVAAMLSLVPLLGAWRVARGPDRATLLACGLLLAATAPVHNVISLSATLQQSRYLYLPAAFFAIFVVELTRVLPARRAGLVLALVVAANGALLRLNAEPFAVSGVVVAHVLEAAGPVVAALSKGAVVELRGLPLAYRGAPMCWGYTIIEPVARRAGVTFASVFVQGDVWRSLPAKYDRAFRFSMDRGFVEEAP